MLHLYLANKLIVGRIRENFSCLSNDVYLLSFQLLSNKSVSKLNAAGSSTIDALNSLATMNAVAPLIIFPPGWSFTSRDFFHNSLYATTTINYFRIINHFLLKFLPLQLAHPS